MSINIVFDLVRYIGKIINYLFFSANSNIAKLFAAISYILAYNVLYRDYIAFFFSYMGLEYIPMETTEFTIWIILSALPFVFYKGVTCISSLFTLLIYLFVYIPVVHGFFITYGISFLSEVVYGITLCFFLSLYFSISPEKSLFKHIELTFKLRRSFIEVIVVLLTLMIVILRRDSLHFVNILTERELLYTLREENSDALSNGMQILAYVQGWLLYAFYPFLLVNYLLEKKIVKSCLIISGYFILFMIDMQKLTLLLPIPMLLMFYLLNNREKKLRNYTHGLMISGLLLISFILFLTKDDELMFDLGCIFLLRTVCVSGWLTQLYIHFFTDNPFTHYGHISFVNALLHNYPYGSEPLGKVVAYGTQNANANFILTDGYAAAGLVGIIVICVIFYFMMQFLNSITAKHGLVPAFIILLPTLALFLNISLFTTFTSNGLIFLILLFMVSKPYDGNKDEDEICEKMEK